jgi:phospholipid transport system substrate-binding protein
LRAATARHPSALSPDEPDRWKDFAGSLIVETRIVKSDGKPVAINYLMRGEAEGWHIADVYLDGTISELAVRRSEFSTIMRDQGIAGLISVLNKKSDLLSGSAATDS